MFARPAGVRMGRKESFNEFSTHYRKQYHKMTVYYEQQDHDTFRRANDPDTPSELLVELSRSENEIIRGAIAYNISTPHFVIDYLLEDPSEHVLSCLRKRGIRVKPGFRKIEKVVGNNLVFRNACIEDAEFILTLRLDADKGKHLSRTSPELSEQISWLERYKNDNSQMYFIILDQHTNSVGTVRLYDQQDDSFCWGSWILKAGSPSCYSIESALMIYKVALRLGFNRSHFDVRKGNSSVWKFHERFGATKIKETTDDYIYNISFDAIHKSLDRYKKYLPNGIEFFEYRDIDQQGAAPDGNSAAPHCRR